MIYRANLRIFETFQEIVNQIESPFNILLRVTEQNN